MKFKKIIGIILAMTMIMSMSHIANADINPGGFPDINHSDQMHAISYLKAFGILKGDGDTGNFRPSHFLTRQEFAVIIARIGDPIPDIDITVNQRLGDPIPGIDITVNQSPGVPPPPPPPSPMVAPTLPYVDNATIADWAYDSVNIVTNYGWVKGYQDGSFGPTNNLTYAEAITVLLRVLGYEDTIDQSQWPAPYIDKAVELGIDVGVDSASSAVITREDMAQLTYNTMFISRLIEQNGEFISLEPIIRDITTAKEVDKYQKGDSVQFYVGDLDFDGDGLPEIIKGYSEILSSSGQPVELWRYLQKIEDLTTDMSKTEVKNNLMTGEVTTHSEQRVADLKKLADELVNIIDLDTSGRFSNVTSPIVDAEPAQLTADLKKLADELVNIYKLAQDVSLIGIDNSNELIGTLVRATFNENGEIFIIEEVVLKPIRIDFPTSN